MPGIDPPSLLCYMAVFSPWKTQLLWKYCLPLLLMLHLTLGNNRGPLIVLDQYEGSGIRLTCISQTLSPDLQLLWVDAKGEELLAAEATTAQSNTTTASSVLLQSGSGNGVSCRIVSKSTKTTTGSTSLVIAEIFFPTTSEWMIAFFVTAGLGMAVFVAIYFKLKQNRWKLALSENEHKAREEEIAQLKRILEKEKNETEKVCKEAQDNYGTTMEELESLRADSHTVPDDFKMSV